MSYEEIEFSYGRYLGCYFEVRPGQSEIRDLWQEGWPDEIIINKVEYNGRDVTRWFENHCKKCLTLSEL